MQPSNGKPDNSRSVPASRPASHSRPTTQGYFPTTSTALFRVFQELLSNVALHSGAEYVHVNLTSDSRFRVPDGDRQWSRHDGRTVEQSPSLGIFASGSASARAMATPTSTVEPGAGTTVTVTVPLRSRQRMGSSRSLAYASDRPALTSGPPSLA